MYCDQKPAEIRQSESRVQPFPKEWLRLKDLYLKDHQSSEYLKEYKSLSKIDKFRIELVSLMERHQKAGRALFHLTLTYKPYNDRNYQEKDVNKFFRTFYLQHFLPYLLQTTHFNRTYWRRRQPIGLAFVDGIEQEGGQQTLRVKKLKEFKLPFQLPALLHHHAILAIHEQTLSNLMSLVGENTVANSGFSYKIMTSDLKQCDATRLLYASKRLKQFPDFMSFPDRMK